MGDSYEYVAPVGERVDAVALQVASSDNRMAAYLSPFSIPTKSQFLRSMAMPRNTRSAALLSGSSDRPMSPTIIHGCPGSAFSVMVKTISSDTFSSIRLLADAGRLIASFVFHVVKSADQNAVSLVMWWHALVTAHFWLFIVLNHLEEFKLAQMID